MPRSDAKRKLEVWTFHAHRDVGDVDYRRLFMDLRGIEPTSRIHVTSEKVVALPVVNVYRSSFVRLQAYEGPRDTQPLVYNMEDGTERLATSEETEVVTTTTHALLDLQTREAIIEYNHRGAKAKDIAVLIGTVGRTLEAWHGLYFEFAPKIDGAFAEELDRFDRIRAASVRLTRPNIDWTDFSNDFADLAADSDAQSGQVELNARRGQSLSKTGGIISVLRRATRARMSAIQSATVRGTREGETAETSLSITDHKAHQTVTVTRIASGQVDDIDIEQKIRSYAQHRRQEAQEADDA